jgi:putative copper resistance protein D
MDVLRKGGPVVFAVAAVAALAVALVVLGDGSTLPPSGQHTAGAGTPVSGLGWGLPGLTLVAYLSAFGLVGALLVAFRTVRRAHGTAAAMAAAGIAGAALTVSSLAAAVTACVADSGVLLDDPRFSQTLGAFITQTGLGRSWLATTVIAAVVTTLSFAVRSRSGVVVLILAALVGLVPLAAQLYASGSPGYDIGVVSTAVYVVVLAMWCGSMLAVPFGRGDDIVGGMRAQSVVGLASFTAAGIAAAIVTQVRFAGDVTSKGGWLTLALAACLLLMALLASLRLSVLGAWRHARPAERNSVPQSALALLWAELAVAGVAASVTVAVSYAGSTTGADDVATGTSPAQILTGNPLPAPVGGTSLGTVRADALWLVVVITAAVSYLMAVRRLRRSGVRWPVRRTVSWLTGLLLLLFLTNGAPALYERYLFSMHLGVMAAQAFLVPLFLVPGSPLRLAFACAGLRGKGAAYHALARAVRSPAAALVARPLVAGTVLAASLWVLVTTQALDWSLTSLLGHEVSMAWLLVAGYAFTVTLVGREPAAYHAAYPARLLMVAAVMASNLALGLFVGLRQGLWAADWFGAMGRTWGLGVVADQQLGGWIFLTLAVAAGLVTTIGIIAVWSRTRAAALTPPQRSSMSPPARS